MNYIHFNGAYGAHDGTVPPNMITGWTDGGWTQGPLENRLVESSSDCQTFCDEHTECKGYEVEQRSQAVNTFTSHLTLPTITCEPSPRL